MNKLLCICIIKIKKQSLLTIPYNYADYCLTNISTLNMYEYLIYFGNYNSKYLNTQ